VPLGVPVLSINITTLHNLMYYECGTAVESTVPMAQQCSVKKKR